MKLNLHRFRTKRWLVLAAPLAPLSVLLGAFLLSAYTSDAAALASPLPLIIGGVLLYAAAIFYLGRVSDLGSPGHGEASDTDRLSQLPNRRAIHKDIERDHKPGEEIAMAMVDLDRFKQVNDHYGHGVGDQLIRECAELMRSICEPEATCYRLGGDEFAITMTGPLSGNILEGICRKILTEFSKPVTVGKRTISVGASIGLARSSGSDGLTSSELLRRSDVAMYASKRGGKMRCTWFSTALDRNREAQREMDEELRRALTNEEFEVHYQPLVDAETREIVAVEALIRWTKPDGSKIGPHIFIPVAEESGFINEIGLWVMRQACTDGLAWDDIMLSVNISAAQLRNPEFPVQLGQILEETGFPADRLELEVTETCLVLDPVVAERNLDVIRGFGVNISLDDFGTGYASIGFLRQFRFEKLKLDRSLVVDAGSDEGSRAMMLSSITVARALNMDVAAEGVETQAQADMVRIAGCDQIQGWLYYKAMPAGQIQQHLPRSEAGCAMDALQIQKGVA